MSNRQSMKVRRDGVSCEPAGRVANLSISFSSRMRISRKRAFLQSCTKLIGFRLLVLTQFFSNCLYLFAEEVFLLILFYLLLDTRLNAFAELCELLLACNNVQKRYAARGTVLLFKKTLPILVFFQGYVCKPEYICSIIGAFLDNLKCFGKAVYSDQFKVIAAFFRNERTERRSFGVGLLFIVATVKVRAEKGLLAVKPSTSARHTPSAMTRTVSPGSLITCLILQMQPISYSCFAVISVSFGSFCAVRNTNPSFSAAFSIAATLLSLPASKLSSV